MKVQVVQADLANLRIWFNIYQQNQPVHNQLAQPILSSARRVMTRAYSSNSDHCAFLKNTAWKTSFTTKNKKS